MKNKPRDIRKEKGINQSDVAKIVGVSYQTVSNWERGFSFPPRSKWKKVAEAYGCDINEIDWGESAK